MAVATLAPGSSSGGASPAGRKRPPQLSWPIRRPPRPGEFLHTRFLEPLHISQTDLAAALGISRRRVNELINGRRALTPDTAMRLAAHFGNDAAFWMQLQVAWDLHGALHQAVLETGHGGRAQRATPPPLTPA